MPTFRKFDTFTADLANGLQDLSSDQLIVALCSSSPSVTNTSISDLVEISYSNISSNRLVTTVSSTQSSGVYRLILQDKVLIASGALPTFQYIAIVNYTRSRLVGFSDAGSVVSVGAGETYTVGFDQANGAVSIQ